MVSQISTLTASCNCSAVSRWHAFTLHTMNQPVYLRYVNVPVTSYNKGRSVALVSWPAAVWFRRHKTLQGCDVSNKNWCDHIEFYCCFNMNRHTMNSQLSAKGCCWTSCCGCFIKPFDKGEWVPVPQWLVILTTLYSHSWSCRLLWQLSRRAQGHSGHRKHRSSNHIFRGNWQRNIFSV